MSVLCVKKKNSDLNFFIFHKHEKMKKTSFVFCKDNICWLIRVSQLIYSGFIKPFLRGGGKKSGFYDN